MAQNIAGQYGGDVRKIYNFLKKHPLSFQRDSNGAEYINFNGHGYVDNMVVLEIDYNYGQESSYLDKGLKKAVNKGFSMILKELTGGIFKKATGVLLTQGSLEADQTLNFQRARTEAVRIAKQRLFSKYFKKSYRFNGQNFSIFDRMVRWKTQLYFRFLQA